MPYASETLLLIEGEWLNRPVRSTGPIHSVDDPSQ